MVRFLIIDFPQNFCSYDYYTICSPCGNYMYIIMCYCIVLHYLLVALRLLGILLIRYFNYMVKKLSFFFAWLIGSYSSEDNTPNCYILQLSCIWNMIGPVKTVGISAQITCAWTMVLFLITIYDKHIL